MRNHCFVRFFVSFFFFKQKTEYEMRISDWSSDVCSSDLAIVRLTDDRPTEDAGLGIVISLVAILVTFVLLAYQRRVVARTGSLEIGGWSGWEGVFQSVLILVVAVSLKKLHIHSINAFC